jgi:hypothetical protein
VATTAQEAIDELADIKATYYKHDQQEPSNEWVVAHNLGKFPSVSVIDTDDSLVIGSVLYLNLNQLKISFTGSFSGKAYLV